MSGNIKISLLSKSIIESLKSVLSVLSSPAKFLYFEISYFTAWISMKLLVKLVKRESNGVVPMMLEYLCKQLWLLDLIRIQPVDQLDNLILSPSVL